MVDAQLSTILEDLIQKTFRSYAAKLEKKAKDERKRYIDLIEKSVKEIIKDEVNSQLSQILPKELSEFATTVIQSTITESLKNVVLAKSSSRPKSTYEAAASLTEFELKKILLDKMLKSKSYRATQEHRDLYDALVKSCQLDKDLFESYGKAYSLKRNHEDKDKDEDPPAGSDQWLKKHKTWKLKQEIYDSTTKTKAAKYDDIRGIKDMASNKVSKHDVFSTKRITAVTHVKVMKWYDYGYLDEIEVRREDQQLYKFREGDFPRLNLRDIEDMLLFLV
uniref:Uncharacterized protein n=1 Tax=Tanacetum cinerariifolium TaxID=118510 RepID=A0A6L2JKX8_TANCI|nr:hypothetical protein [Tanacetum cinerariifolium]